MLAFKKHGLLEFILKCSHKVVNKTNQLTVRFVMLMVFYITIRLLIQITIINYQQICSEEKKDKFNCWNIKKGEILLVFNKE